MEKTMNKTATCELENELFKKLIAVKSLNNEQDINRS